MKLKVGSEFGGTVVDEKGVFCLAFFIFVFCFCFSSFSFSGANLRYLDVKALLGDNVGLKRTVDQAIAAVGHRINCSSP